MKNLLLQKLALLSLVAMAFANTLPTDGNFYAWSFGAVGSTSTPTFTSNFGFTGIIQVTDAFCAGDQFEVFIDNVSVGKTSTPIPADGCVTSTTDPKIAINDSRWSSGLFVVPAGTHTISFKAVQAPFGGGTAYVKANTAVCRTPPGVPSDQFAVVLDIKVPFTSYPDKCSIFGLETAQLTSANAPLASQTLRKCNNASPAWIKSWNSDTYGGFYPIAFYASETGGTVNSAAGPLYSLCQKRQPVSEISFAGYKTIGRSPDQKLFVVGPPMPYSEAGSACASFGGAVPAILRTTQQTLINEASALTFSAAGPNGKTWIGGWETSSPNSAYTLGVGSTSGPGAVTAADPNTNRLYVICATPGSGADKKKRSVDEL